MTLREFITENSKILKQNNKPSPRLDVELFICHVCHMDRVSLITHWDRKLKENELNQLTHFVQRRVQGEPVAYILGHKDFYKYRFKVDARVLVPRPETELIVEKVLHWIKDKKHPYGILDMGTGSGCIGLSLSKELENSQLTAVDLSEKALAVFGENTKSLQLSQRVTPIHSDVAHLHQILNRGSYDIVVANPPYVPHGDRKVCKNVVAYEPHMALFAEKTTGVLWMKQALYLLRDQGAVFMMEFNWEQGDELKKQAQKMGEFVQLVPDYNHRNRLLYCVR